MKKGTTVMVIVAVLSFFVSLIAVASSFAAKATQTAPTSQQKPSMPPIKDQIKAKDRFWDLAVDHCVINNEFIAMSPCGNNKTITVKVGQPVNFQCYYKVKTIPVNDITVADAAYWGSRNLTYKILSAVVNGQVHKQETRNLPHFTWEEVKKWQQTIKSPGCKTWNENMIFSWTPTKGGADLFVFKVDDENVINEADGPTQNNWCTVGITVTP